MRNTAMALFLMSGLFLGAQEGERKGNRAHWKAMSPEQVATLQTKKMTLALDLSPEQQEQMKTLFTTKAEERKAQMEARQEQKATNSEKPTTAESYERANGRLDDQIAFKKQVSQILSEEQYAEWEKMQKHKKHRGKGTNGKHGHRKEGN